jgi:hypothetical protein
MIFMFPLPVDDLYSRVPEAMYAARNAAALRALLFRN